MRLLARMGRRRSRDKAGESAEGFDPEFYRTRYPDLAHLRDADSLVRHYLRNGRAEGRVANEAELIARLEQAHGPLPAFFDPNDYAGLNPDLRKVFTQLWQFSSHYLEFGRAEGRLFSAIDDDLADTFKATAGPSDAEGVLAFLHRHGLSAGPWLKHFRLADFALANENWLPKPSTRAEGIRAFVEHGIKRLAPISLASRFDPDFHRANYTSPEIAGLNDGELYRRWLTRGISWGEPPNEDLGLSGLIGGTAFPTSFREDAYRALRSDVPAGRFRALEHFVTTGFAAGIESCLEGDGSDTFCEAIGRWHEADGAFQVALRAYDRALAQRETSSRRHGRGEVRSSLGDFASAAEDYEAATRLPNAVAWSFIHAAGLWSKLGDHQRALDILERGGSSAMAAWRDAAETAIKGRFAAESEAARALYVSGLRADADGLMSGAIAAVGEAWARYGFLPAALPPAEHGPIVILANRDLPQCEHYRVEQKRRQLEHGGWTVEMHEQHAPGPFIDALIGARAAIFYRTAAFPDTVRAILHARALGVPTFYEVDDLIFDPSCYPDPFESFEGQITAEDYAGLQFGVPLFRGAMALCDAGIASTPALADAMRPIVRGGTCHVLRNALDQRNDPYAARPLRVPKDAGPMTVFYGSGTKAHNADFTQLAAPGLLRLLQRDPRVRLVVAGYLALDERFTPYRDRVHQLGFTRDVDAYWELLANADINLAVLAPSAPADAKSEIKWLEAAVFGIPSIVSGTRTHREILIDGEDAFLADGSETWAAALERLAGDAELRRRVGAAARAKALAGYGLDRAVEALAKFLPPPDRRGLVSPWALARDQAERAAQPYTARDTTRLPPKWSPPPLGAFPFPASRPTHLNPKPRILIVNVFFPPQTIGGATRVVRDNVDYFLDHAGGKFDLFVVSADDGAEVPYRLRADAYRGMPVLRIATPAEENMDWRPTDPTVGGLFGALLERLAPDLVHFHCVQRLTASVVEEVRARAIPYLITVHDGWWLGDHQFLMDEDGLVRVPTPDVVATSSAQRIPTAASVARRGRLAQALDSAAQVLAVSETFAELYRAAGVAKVHAVPNGLPALAPLAPRPHRNGGRVHLGHIGGRSAHKGATLLEAVLRANQFENLHLTLVELDREPGDVTEETWGTTPVKLIGRVPQSNVADLYAQLDVVLAPSLWPESFGLVTREARAYGLWVVASDRGAVAEGLTDGVDGLVIDVGSSEGLRRALEHIDAEPGRFKEAPAPKGPTRGAADQAAELLVLYKSLL